MNDCVVQRQSGVTGRRTVIWRPGYVVYRPAVAKHRVASTATPQGVSHRKPAVDVALLDTVDIVDILILSIF